MINRWGSLQTSDNFSPGKKLAVAIVVCASHGCARTTSAWAMAT